MGLSEKRITPVLLVILSVLNCAGIYLLQVPSANRILLCLNLFILVIMAGVNRLNEDRCFLAVFCINLASLILTITWHKTFGVAIMFLNVLLACHVFNNIQADRRAYLWMHFITALTLSVFVIAGVKGAYPVYNSGTLEIFQFKAFGVITQKNTQGILALCCMFHWICLLETLSKDRIKKIICAIPVFCVFFLKITEANCRSAIMASAVFAVLYIFTRHEIPYRTYYILLIAALTVTGLFTIYYVENVTEIIETDEIMGGSPFNRLGTWKAALSLIGKYPVFGSGTDIKMLIYDSAHNTVLSWLKTIGLIPAVTFVLYFAKRTQGRKNAGYNRVSQMMVISGLMVAVFESFYADSHIGMLFLMLLINPEKDGKYDTEADPLLLVRRQKNAGNLQKIYKGVEETEPGLYHKTLG